MFAFNSFLVSQNSICKVNIIPKSNLTCQLFLYTPLYSIVGLDFKNVFKGWRETTETTTIWCILTIFKHWGINVKPHFLHIFFISDWNYKHFKCICILCFIIPLIGCLMEIRFMCAKPFFNPIKIKIKTTLWSCRLNL